MSNHTILKITGILSCSLFVLAACGGGGSGSGDNPAAASAPVTISAANAPQVSGAAYDSAIGLDNAASSGSVLTGAVTQAGGGVDITGAIVSVLGAAQPLISGGQFSSLTGVVVSGSDVCAGGGSFSFTLDDVDNNSDISTGDTMDLSFNNCNEAGVVLSGGLSLTGLVVSGDITTFPYSLQFTMQMKKLQTVENGESTKLDGTATFVESTTDGVVFNNSLSGSSIQYTAGGITVTVTAFRLDTTEDSGTGVYTLDASAAVSSSSLGGTATVVTDVPFQGAGSNDPFIGQATITGASNTRVTLIALDAVNVRLEVDEDGDGVTDTTIDTTWDAL